MRRKFINGFQLWAAGYAVLTVVSCVAQLINGTASDTNINILARALVCLAPIVAYYLFGFGKKRKWTKTLLLTVFHYVISLGCALLLVYLTGLIQANAPHAYLEIFISFTVTYVVVSILIGISNRRARKADELLK